jgi:outer membrane lipoprotein SlyB
MSREERRAYQRMAKKQDPYALPTSGPARARQQQLERRKARRAATQSAAPGSISRRFLAWALGGAAVGGLIAFSLAWPSGMPFAAYVGAGVALGWVAVAFGLRALTRRSAPRP